jgi:pimeloyl-ACP methyl ester carboxylesterase
MHFVRAGRGAPALVFVHGFACSHEDWQAQLDFFSRTNEVVACDLRGHGDTPGRAHECSIEHYGGDVAALINNLELERAVLIGHSMGCRVVLEANRIASERIASIVLVDGSRLASGNPHAAEAAARRTVENAGYASFAEHLFRQMFFRPSALADEIVERAVRSSAEFGPALWPRMARWDAERMDEALGSVRSPLMAIQTTTRDAQLRRTPLKPGDTSPWLQLLEQAVPGARLEIISGVGHFPQLEAPDEVNRLLSEFVSQVR